METLKIQTKSRTQFVDVTADVQRAVSHAGVTEGVMTVFCPQMLLISH